MSEPLDERTIEIRNKNDGIKEVLPALHPKWIEEEGLVELEEPPKHLRDSVIKEEWLEHAKQMVEDLKWLLSLSHQLFWCQVMFDDSVKRCLQSCLDVLPRQWDPVQCWQEDAEIRSVMESINRSVFMVYLRLSTHKEEREHHLNAKVFGEMLWKQKLVDISRLMDLCSIYGRHNKSLLAKMLQNIFKHQPRFVKDFENVLPAILDALLVVETKCRHGDSKLLSVLSWEKFSDLCFYTVDVINTVECFANVYPAALDILHGHDMTIRIATFSECVFPALYSELKKRLSKPSHSVDLQQVVQLQGRLSLTKEMSVKLFHQLLTNAYLRPILDNSDSGKGHSTCPSEGIDKFLDVITNILGEKRFLLWYEKMFPLKKQLDDLSSHGQIDHTRTEYILSAIEDARKTFLQTCTVTQNHVYTSDVGLQDCNKAATTSGTGQIPVANADVSASSMPTNSAEGGVSSVTDVKMESLLSSINDVLPGFGRGFLIACLKHYNNNSEVVIHHLLEDSLADDLKALDKTADAEVTGEREESKKEDGSDLAIQSAGDPNVFADSLVASRSNAFDNDEFDVFRRDDIDERRVFRNKKGANSKSVLDDKSCIESVRATYEKFSCVSDDVDGDGMYDDEYDDTYDGNQVGAKDADDADELTSRRLMVTPRIFGGNSRFQQEEDLEDENSEDDESEQLEEARKSQNFLEDPAVLRARAAERAASMRGARGGRPDRGGGGTSNTAKSRARNEKNKARAANHNRKRMSDRKSSRGMF